LGVDFDPAAAGGRRRHHDRPAAGRIGKAGTDRPFGRQDERDLQYGGPRRLRHRSAKMSHAGAALLLIPILAMGGQAMAAPAAPASVVKPDAISVLVGELSIDRYKADIKALTQFGDRRQGTKRNRDAIN